MDGSQIEEADVKTNQNKTVLVTGGSRGIGKAIVEIFSKNGWKVATCSTQVSNLSKLPAEVKFQCDISNKQEVIQGIQKTIEAFGKIDVLVNNAGLSGSNPLNPDESDDIWHRIIDVNLNGTYYMCKYASPYLPEGQGRVINIASVLALKGVPDATAYCAAKHGVLGFTRALAQEFSSRKIPVNAVCPGWVRTDMARDRMGEIGLSEEGLKRSVPLGRMIEPQEIAEFVFFLASSPAASMITGQALTMDGGTLA